MNDGPKQQISDEALMWSNAFDDYVKAQARLSRAFEEVSAAIVSKEEAAADLHRVSARIRDTMR